MPGRARRFFIGPPARSVRFFEVFRSESVMCGARPRNKEQGQKKAKLAGLYTQKTQQFRAKSRAQACVDECAAYTYTTCYMYMYTTCAHNAPDATMGWAPPRGPGTRAGLRTPPPTMRGTGAEGAGRGIVDGVEKFYNKEGGRVKGEDKCERVCACSICRHS